MKAARYYGARDVRVESVLDAPVAGPHEVRLEVVRAGICGSDAAEFAAGPKQIPIDRVHPGNGHRGPVILGHEFVGRVASVGSGVEALRVGDRVVPGAGVWCGACEWCAAGRTNLCEKYYTHGLQADGGLAELVTVPALMCRPVPDVVSDDAAAMAQPLAVALHAVGRAAPEAGQVAVLIGVGGVGHFALTALAARRPGTLVVVDLDEERLAGALAAGATHVVNPAVDDPREVVSDLTGGSGAHVVVEASGAAPSPALAVALVRRGGSVVLVGLQKASRELDLHSVVMREVNLVSTLAHVCDVDLPIALELLRDPGLGERAIDRVIPLDAVVDEGLVPLAQGRVAGKVIVRLR
ncbi:zinc containing alcohol dehydrogenase superfamily protein [Baekduia alba]|uniref:zinc-dependent alcohol dehydrogenase n=1 Tax=Baekduia alba TaxID=2997333 RepID=UPI002340F9F7|nr:alcohol dehydrogenase catalytic domain-containing protein [Baekduia alba]WCB91739.1 zinc containing alcohol dehydrogenase superfamily protein [Baekduia alba]